MTAVPGRMRVLPCGEDAVLLEFADLDAVRAASAALRASPVAGVLDVVPAARTVLVVVDPVIDLATIVARLRSLPTSGADARSGADPATGGRVTVGVVYDGPDLDDVAAHTGLSRDEVVAVHTATPWTVAFDGFVPGFGYLVGPDARLHVPRRSTPRTRVPAGAVGLAGEFTGAYPRPSPGGWQLIGRTEEVLWDETRDPPALFRPGVQVRFVAVGP